MVGATGAAGVAPTESTTPGTLANGLWSGVAQLLPQVYTLAISAAAARVLGAEGMGQQSFIAFVSVSLVLVGIGGLPQALAHSVGRCVGQGRPEAVRGLLSWAFRLEVAGAVLGAGVLVAVSFFRVELRGAWLFAAATCFVGVLQTIPAAVLNGLQRWREATAVGVITGFIGVAATVGALAAGLGITGMFAVEALVGVVNLLGTGRLARRALAETTPDSAVHDIELRRSVLRYARGATLQMVLTFVVFRRSEFFFLDRFSKDTEIALYSVSYAAVTALGRFPEAMSTVVFSSVATLAGAGDLRRISVGFARIMRLSLLVTVPPTALGMALGPDLLRLVYGDEFAGTRVVLLLLLVTLPLLSLLVAARSVVTGIGDLRVLLTWGGIAAVVNIILGITLVAELGAVGAAIANGTGQIVAGVPVLVEAVRLVGGVEWSWSGTVRTAIASLVGAIVALAVVTAVGGLAGVVVGAAAGTLSLALLSARLGVVRSDDAAWLVESLGPGLGRTFDRLSRPFIVRTS